MTNKFDLRQLLKEKVVEERLRKKTERHLTQEDIRKLIQESQHPKAEEEDGH